MLREIVPQPPSRGSYILDRGRCLLPPPSIMAHYALDPTAFLSDTSFPLTNWPHHLLHSTQYVSWTFSAVQMRIIAGKATPEELKSFHELSATLRHLASMVDATVLFRGHCPVRTFKG